MKRLQKKELKALIGLALDLNSSSEVVISPTKGGFNFIVVINKAPTAFGTQRGHARVFKTLDSALSMAIEIGATCMSIHSLQACKG